MQYEDRHNVATLSVSVAPDFEAVSTHIRSLRAFCDFCLWVLQIEYYSLSSVICHTTGPQPLPKRFLHLMRSRASSFKLEYPLLSPRSSSNFLRLLPRLLVTSNRPFIFPSITSFRRLLLSRQESSFYAVAFQEVFRSFSHQALQCLYCILRSAKSVICHNIPQWLALSKMCTL